MRKARRQFLGGTLGLLAAGRGCSAAQGGEKPAPVNFPEWSWRLDPACVLPRGPHGSYDARVVGDPCIVWDEERGTWRMFYFASGRGSGTGLALSRSEERIGPGDWDKAGQPELVNPADLVDRRSWHKWWVVMDLDNHHRAARIEGRYWALMVSARQQKEQRERKHIQVAHAGRLGGPWTIVAQPILAPQEGFLDGLHCDTPTAFWMPRQERVAIFYKGYPWAAQSQQPGSWFGSGTILAYWHPRDVTARRARILLRPGVNDTWLQGWISTPQIFFDAERCRWYGLINGSPTPPTDESHREPAPSFGGWVLCDGPDLEGPWRPDTEHSPLCRPEHLTQTQREAGLGANFWRHHLLVTPKGQARIYFNSGPYGKEQMYSFVAER